MKYECDVCKREVERSDLVVKRASFHEMGRGGKMLKQRVVAWVCKSRCLGEDKHWNIKSFAKQEKQKKEVSS